MVIELPGRRVMLSVRRAGEMQHLERINAIYPAGATHAATNTFNEGQLNKLRGSINL